MLSRFMLMMTLVFAGEAVYLLPFHTTRFFRPTMLESFGLTNTQLGDVFAVYGVLAMLAYFPGGALADRFSARSLLTASLVATSAGGLYMATFPSALGLAFLFAYWGITTILLFWAALIRATREWGGHDEQGRAFGILEGGRGLVAALLASGGVMLLAMFMPDNLDQLSNEERKAAFRTVIYFYSFVTLAAAAMTWIVIPPVKHIGDSTHALLRNSLAVLGRGYGFFHWLHARDLLWSDYRSHPRCQPGCCRPPELLSVSHVRCHPGRVDRRVAFVPAAQEYGGNLAGCLERANMMKCARQSQKDLMG